MPTGAADTAIYARISLDRQDGAGVDRQLEDCRELCARRGWQAREYADNHHSAWRAGARRPKYEDLIHAVRTGEVGRIVVYKTDRLHRQPRELEDLIAFADRGRVEVVAIEGGELDLATSDGRALARVLAAMNAKESDDKADRVRRAKRQAREAGKPHGGPRPFGWRRITTAEPDGSQRATWDPMAHDPLEADLIRSAVADLLAGASLNDIARQWNAAGVSQPQTGGSHWTADQIRQVVSNPRNAGLVGHRKQVKSDRPYQMYSRPEVVGEAKWPAIVDRAIWEQLQALLAQRGAFARTPKRRSLLTGLLVCGQCGATMVRTADHARRRDADGPYRKVWRCPTYTRNDAAPSCGRVTIDAAGVEGLLVARTLDKAAGLDLAAVVEGQDGRGREAAELVAQLADLDRRAAEAASSFAKPGGITLLVLESTTAAIEHERTRVKKQLGELASGTLLAPYLAEPDSLREAWEHRLTIDQKRELIRILVGRVRILTARRGLPRFDPDRVVWDARGRISRPRKRLGRPVNASYDAPVSG